MRGQFPDQDSGEVDRESGGNMNLDHGPETSGFQQLSIVAFPESRPRDPHREILDDEIGRTRLHVPSGWARTRCGPTLAERGARKQSRFPTGEGEATRTRPLKAGSLNAHMARFLVHDGLRFLFEPLVQVVTSFPDSPCWDRDLRPSGASLRSPVFALRASSSKEPRLCMMTGPI